MELKAFIKASLLETMNAIYEAQTEWRETVGKGAINPAWEDTSDLHRYSREIEFDVAVTAAKSASGKANAGIKVMSLDIGAGGQVGSENSTVSRIKFTVPIVPPVAVITGGGRPYPETQK
nr:hypothetical protein [uncultured Brevundimonas sp.]